jgi:hypothetical protein
VTFTAADEALDELDLYAGLAAAPVYVDGESYEQVRVGRG